MINGVSVFIVGEYNIRDTMVKKGTIITGLFAINILLQFLSQLVITRFFGAKLEVEIFLAAVTIPTLLVTVIYSTLNDAFLPLYVEKSSRKTQEGDEFFLSTLISLVFFSIIALLFLLYFGEFLAYMLFGNKGWYFVKSVSTQMSILMSVVPVAIVATLFGSYYYANKKFVRFPFAQAVGNCISFLTIFFFVPIAGITALTSSFIINIFSQILLLFPKKMFDIKLKSLDITPVLASWLPLIISITALRSDVLITRAFAADLPPGYFVYTNLISRIFSLATGVTTIGIQVLLLPHIVELIQHNEHHKAFKLTSTAKKWAFAISLVVSISLVFIIPFIIKLLFIGGKFNERDANATIALLPYFLIPAIGWGIHSVFYQPLIAIKKNFELCILSIISLVLAWVGGLITKAFFDPLLGITVGLSILLFTGILGSELLWRHYKKNLLK